MDESLHQLMDGFSHVSRVSSMDGIRPSSTAQRESYLQLEEHLGLSQRGELRLPQKRGFPFWFPYPNQILVTSGRDGSGAAYAPHPEPQNRRRRPAAPRKTTPREGFREAFQRLLIRPK